MRPLTDESDRLKKDLEIVESDVAVFSKRCDLANQAQEITAKVLAEANAHRERLIDKIVQLEETVECYDLKSENFNLKSETDEEVKARVENFKSQFKFTSDYENLQTFFVNFGARQALAEVKELYPNLDLFAIEVDYPAPEEVEDGMNQPSAEGAKDGADQPNAEGA
ncbi:uncharacterized protein Fot_07535 [Forsythia ovata]|uniref:Uncharacterized protein n=1 Tax=Forsythia ovata TaxID=205694 RepID=A0ABD1WW43_9LAMI